MASAEYDATALHAMLAPPAPPAPPALLALLAPLEATAAAADAAADAANKAHEAALTALAVCSQKCSDAERKATETRVAACAANAAANAAHAALARASAGAGRPVPRRIRLMSRGVVVSVEYRLPGGELHRDGGPAVVYNEISRGRVRRTIHAHYAAGKLHRARGPAKITWVAAGPPGEALREEYFWHGKAVTAWRPAAHEAFKPVITEVMMALLCGINKLGAGTTGGPPRIDPALMEFMFEDLRAAAPQLAGVGPAV
jgi:hypothetical protein